MAQSGNQGILQRIRFLQSIALRFEFGADLTQLGDSLAFLVTDQGRFVACLLLGLLAMTTLGVLALAAWSEARGRTSVQIFGRRIPRDVQRVALSVVAWGSTIVALSTIIITQITGEQVGRVLFDVISGFGTVGLSTGVTANLPDSAIYVMALTIFMGRIGTVTLAAAVAATSRSQLYALPVERPIVG